MQETKITIYGTPVTKKNSQRIISAGGHPKVIPSLKYELFERDTLKQLYKIGGSLIADRVNVKCVYYMPTHRRVDLVNLLEATLDILVRGGVLEDDNCGIVVGHDGSRVLYDKENPRTEVTISAEAGSSESEDDKGALPVQGLS